MYPRGQQHLEYYGAAANDEDEDEIMRKIMEESLRTAEEEENKRKAEDKDEERKEWDNEGSKKE